ncbi:hypothetical protein PRUPE_2G313100 [Prunus persica]|uniref:Uncharacterized protein n=1 Tax=Prunus persica TaxID=3760 RepID=M5X122_PRUPE|nr:uncharacterized protein LOC18784712 [Prunus persica]ONI25651.1 hypothetical protein PRUPE_2G313100 [Prunus persica]ONI25652.1 hypothetical protein PRUPE_2G313100 [Prunus persica]ONI25653.1 hypothetical protein PRUPE_2G313100 [Prunus persica]
MAAAEARTAWQCRANCRFVQEDVRIAPRFSSFPSSSSSKAESDSAPENAPEGIDHFTPGCMSYNPSSELAPNTKWWLNLEPNFGPHKEFTYEQLKLLEAELEDLNSGFVNKPAIISDYYQCNGVIRNQNDRKNTVDSFVEQPCKVSVTCSKNDQSKGMQELKAETGNDPQLPKKRDPGEFWYSDDHLMNLDSFNCLSSEEPKKLSSGLESQWVGTEKTEPWWRSAGKDELASLVAQKSLEHIENCDLPRPQIKHSRKGPSAFDPNSSIDQMAELGFSNMDTYTWGSFTSGHSTHESDSPSSQNNDYGTISKDEVATQNNAEDDRSKAELLEALCHSQTRARKAEEAAQQAYTEKEHIITLFLKQASQLFAYKQWLQLLQLENFCLQRNSKKEPISGLFPACFPWSPYKGRHMKKAQRRAGKRIGRPRYEISKGAVAFALGLGLAGAGLLLGWTMGWLFPTI